MNSPCQSFFFFFLNSRFGSQYITQTQSCQEELWDWILVTDLHVNDWILSSWCLFVLQNLLVSGLSCAALLGAFLHCSLYVYCWVLPVAKLSKDQLLGFLVSPLGIYREQVFFFNVNYQRTTFWQNDTFASISMQVEEHWCTIMS